MARYYVEEPCEHGQVGRHAVGPDRGGRWDENYPTCPGGSRRELEDVEIVDWPGDETPEDFKLPTRLAVSVSKSGRYAIIPLSGDTE